MSDSEDKFSVNSVKSCLGSDHRVKRLREKINGAKDHKRLKELIFEYDDVIHSIQTTILNSWHNIEGYKFCKSKGSIILRKNDSKYNTNKQIMSEVERCNVKIEMLQKYIEQIILILDHNNLQLPRPS
jgi:hypothetical protein